MLFLLAQHAPPCCAVSQCFGQFTASVSSSCNAHCLQRSSWLCLTAMHQHGMHTSSLRLKYTDNILFCERTFNDSLRQCDMCPAGSGSEGGHACSSHEAPISRSPVCPHRGSRRFVLKLYHTISLFTWSVIMPSLIGSRLQSGLCKT